MFSLKNNAILHNRVILYFIFLVSLGNLFYLTVERDITSILVFLLVGFLTAFFSKNMLIILFVALITSSLIKYGAGVRHEGLENRVDPPDDSGNAEEPAPDTDLSNEIYLDEDVNRRTRRVENYEGEEDAEEDVVENYEGEDSAGDSKGTKDSKSTSDSKKKDSEESVLSACIRKCMG